MRNKKEKNEVKAKHKYILDNTIRFFLSNDNNKFGTIVTNFLKGARFFPSKHSRSNLLRYVFIIQTANFYTIILLKYQDARA